MAEPPVQPPQLPQAEGGAPGREAALSQHAKRIGIQDGTSRSALRDWLEEVTSAKEWTKATDVQVINMIGYLLKGDLDRAVRDYIRDRPYGVTWQAIQAFIADRFLDQDEQEYLRKRVDTVRQAVHQDVRDFAVVFDQKVKAAYHPAERAVPLVQERLIRTFVDGLASREIRRQCHAARPQTLADAYAIATTADRADQLAGRHEEPMEIGPVQRPVKNPKPDPVSGALDAVLKRLGEVERVIREQSASASPKLVEKKRRFGKPAWNADGTPNCFRCGQRGHIGKDCPRFGWSDGPPSGNRHAGMASKNASAPLPGIASSSV